MKGFTLIELLLVILIIGTLSSVVLSGISADREETEVETPVRYRN